MAVKKKTRTRKTEKFTINFSGVESGGRKCPDGDYEAEITSAEVQESSSGNPMMVVKWKIASGKFKGVTIYDNVSLVPQALWKMKGLLEAIGVEPQEEDVEPEDYAKEMVEKTATVTVTNETYEGEQRPKITGYGEGEESEESDEEEEEEEEEEEPKVRNKKKPAKDEDEDKEEEEEEEDEDEDEEEEEESKPAKGGVKKKIKEGSRVKFEDDDGNVVKGTVTSLDNGEATVEDKAGDEYVIDAKHLTAL